MADEREENLGYFFTRTARGQPENTALVDLWAGEERRRTYGELDERCERVGAALARHLAPGSRLALVAGNRIEFVEAFFGAMRAGLVPVPLNPRQPASALRFMIEDAGCRGALIDLETAPDAADPVESLDVPVRIAIGRDRAGWRGFEDLVRDGAGPAPGLPSPDGIALQPYTAGSTGRPKGVRLTHRGMLWSIRTTQDLWPTSPDEIGLIAVPLFHKNAMRGTIKPVLYAGAAAVILPRFEPVAFLEALARYRITFAGGVPAIFSMLLPHRDLIARLDLSALRYFSIGSAVVPDELVTSLQAAFPGISIKESYGLTEGGGPLRPPADGEVPRGSCGVAAPGYEVRLVDAEGRESPERGELWTRSPYVTEGYHNLPEVTRERIVDGWLRTGDLFRVDRNGFFYFLGRTDDMFSCGGENIYPKEVENLLLRHPAIFDACVAPIPHAIKGFVPAAMVVLKAGARAAPDEIRSFALENGPAYAHPRRVAVVQALPLTGAGKVDRKAVAAALASAAEQAETA